jgi:catechol 2,3-dioxygenase-like lactoylglutathione lyase family enzyme
MAAERYRRGWAPRSKAPRPSGSLSLDHVQVAAPATGRPIEPAARAFYGQLLGLDEVEKPAVLTDRGGVWFALADAAALHVGVDPSPEFIPATKAHPAFRVADEAALKTLAERLERAGVPVRWDDPLPGVAARFFTNDPWGNRLELLC